MKLLTLLVPLCLAAFPFSQSAQSASEPKFSELSPEDSKRLDQQRAVVAAVAKQRYGSALSRTKRDLPLLQRLIDDNTFTKSQTYALQSLGVAFGDVLAGELPLRWVIVTDEFGTGPTLRFKDTSININALTMISKRVERGERVDVCRLLQKSREELSDAEKKLH